VEPDDELVALLQLIDRRLALLTATHDRDLRAALRTDLLRTPARIAMFEGINGERGSGELSKLARGSERSAQEFVKELLGLGLVRAAPGSAGRSVIVERDEDAIIEWYLQRNAAA
jgi:hypothetical protein